MPAPLVEVLARAKDLGFLGDGPVSTHVNHSVALAACVEGFLSNPEGLSSPSRAQAPTPERFLDLGSGGGIPGLVLAALWPESRGVLLDASDRRTAILAEAIETLGWGDRIQVVRDRAEVAGRLPVYRAGFDVAVARSFGPPPMTAECGAPFLRPGGLLFVSEPPATDHALSGLYPSNPNRWPEEGLGLVGLAPVSAWRRSFGFQVLRLTQRVPDVYPRRNGVPTKRPLYRVPRET